MCLGWLDIISEFEDRILSPLIASDILSLMQCCKYTKNQVQSLSNYKHQVFVSLGKDILCECICGSFKLQCVYIFNTYLCPKCIYVFAQRFNKSTREIRRDITDKTVFVSSNTVSRDVSDKSKTLASAATSLSGIRGACMGARIIW